MHASPAFGELLRYAVNGVIATGVHFVVLTFAIDVLAFSSAGVAGFAAALCGIAASFVGSRYFVFRHRDGAIGTQALRFVALYGTVAVIHGLVLTLWTDFGRFDYRWGFLIATAIQIAASFWGNKRLVFAGGRR